METRLLNILVCPLCKGPLISNTEHTELVCKADHLAFPVRDGIPVMLSTEARVLDDASAHATNVRDPSINPATDTT
jgi:uncharacterized protein YbaR (Trm112 family)